MYYYLYKITNLVNNKIYVGVHQTKNLDDDYMGSGKIIRKAIEKYGVDNFRKEIMEFFSDYESMMSREREIINEEFLSRDDVYNLKIGGTGGFEYITKNRLNLTREVLSKRTESIRLNHKLNPRKVVGVPHTGETKMHLSAVRKQFFANGGEHPRGMLGKSHKEETKRHVSLVLKEKSSMIGKKGLDHPTGGTKWYNNGQKHIRSDVHPGAGWIEGRIFKERKKRK